MSYSIQKYTTLKVCLNALLNRRSGRFGFTAISIVTVKRRIRFSMDATLRLMADSSAGLLLDCYQGFSHRRHICLVLRTVDSRWISRKLALGELWLGSNFKLHIHSRWRTASMATTSAMRTAVSFLRTITSLSGQSFARVCLNFTVSGSRYS